MRDHTGLRGFQLADELAMLVYRLTNSFPASEQFGLTNQMRRAAVSAASNIVEGCGRSSQKDYVHFLDIALGSVREVGYQASLAHRLGLLDHARHSAMDAHCTETSRTLCALILAVRNPKASRPRQRGRF